MEQLSLFLTEKRCTVCGEVKPVADFPRNRRAKDGRHCECKPCHCERSRRYWEENREQRRAYAKRYYQANRDERLAWQREYARQHAEERKAYVAARQATPEYRAGRRVYEKRYWDARRDDARQKGHRWRARQRETTIGDVSPGALRVKWDYWAGCCWICGKDADSWDHVKPLSKGGAHCLANLRPACRSCNARKKDRWPFAA